MWYLYTKFAALLFLLLTLPFVNASGELLAAENKITQEVETAKKNVLFTSNFVSVPHSGILSNYDSTQYKRRKVAIEKIKAMPDPVDWIVQSWTVRPDTSWYLNGRNEFAVKSSSIFYMYSKQLFRASNKEYEFVLEVECPADSDGKSVVGVGFCLYGLYENNISLKKVQQFDILPGERKTIVIPARFSKWNSKFRLAVSAQGSMILKNMEFRELPDKIVPDMVDLSATTTVTGYIKAISELPSPEESDYPDCRYTVHFEGVAISEGKPCPREIQLSIDGFANYKLLKSADLKENDIITCVIAPFTQVPQSLQSVQQADDLELFTLDSYIALNLEKVKKPSSSSPIPFIALTDHVSIFERDFNPPIDNSLQTKQRDAIEADLQYLHKILAPYTQEKRDALKRKFAEIYEQEKRKDSPNVNRFVRKNIRYVWRNIDNTFWVLPENFIFYNNLMPLDKVNLQSMIDLQKFLNQNGVQFIVALTPVGYDIASRVINQDFRNVPDFRTAYLAQQLLENGIETIYASDEIIKNYQRYPFAFFMHNNHPADTAQEVIADILTAKLKRYNFPENLNRKQFSRQLNNHVYHGGPRAWEFLFPENCDIGSHEAGSEFLNRQVLYQNKEVVWDSESPVLIIGNSMMQTPMRHESLPALLSEKLSMGIDVLRVSASGPHTVIMEKFVEAPELLLQGKKVVVMVVKANDFYIPIKFYNVRELDQIKLALNDKSFCCSLTPLSNTEKAFDFDSYAISFKKTSHVTVPDNGKYTLLNTALTQLDMAKETLLLLKIIGNKTSQKSFLKINSQETIPVCSEASSGKTIIVKLPAGVKELKIEFISPDIREIIVDNIQVFQ